MGHVKVFFAVAGIFVGSLVHAQDICRYTEEGMRKLLTMRNDTTGIWTDAGWWNSANVLTAVVRYAAVNGNTEGIDEVIEDVFVKANEEAPGFINDYYDDEGWWALAWIDAWRLTGRDKYLDTARFIFDDMVTGWTPEYGGGIFWKKPGVYKNAIANNLFSLCAAKLYNATGESRYRDWFALNTEWFIRSGMISSETGLVEDGLKNGIPTTNSYYTYNQGVAIAVLAEMYVMTRKEKYLDMAVSIADSTLEKMVYENGVLREYQEPNLNADGIQFKGIFMRHFARLYEITKKEPYRDFILLNAQSIIMNNSDSGNFGGVWTGPFDKLHSGAHSSAMECLIEACLLSMEDY